MDRFVVHAPFKPMGDQPQAVAKIAENFANGEKAQVLRGPHGPYLSGSHLCYVPV